MSAPSTSEIDIWSRAISPEDDGIPVADAHVILRWAFNDQAKARMDELAQRNGQGTLIESERQELEAYVHVGQVIAILQAKARLSLKRAGEDGNR